MGTWGGIEGVCRGVQGCAGGGLARVTLFACDGWRKLRLAAGKERHPLAGMREGPWRESP